MKRLAIAENETGLLRWRRLLDATMHLKYWDDTPLLWNCSICTLSLGSYVLLYGRVQLEIKHYLCNSTK